MANTLTAILPKILARTLLALRKRTVMPRLINRGYEMDIAAKKGDAVTIPVPTAVGTRDVTPSNTPPAPVDTAPGSVVLTLDEWRQTDPFHLTDQELTQIDQDENFLPGQMSEGVSALANYANEKCFALYTGVYGFAGTPGTTPFKETTPVVDVATEAMQILNEQDCPPENRRAVLDWAAHAAAAALPAFSNAHKKGSDDTLISGELGRVFGFDWYGDGQVPYHTTAAAGTPLIDSAGGYAVGTKTIHMDGFTTKPEAGDIFTIPNRASGASDTQTYVVVSSTALVGTDSDVTFEPGLAVTLAAGDDDETVLFKASHRVNLAFHRDAFAFASRPLQDTDLAGTGNMLTMPDPVTGLVMRVEVSRQHKQTAVELDMLFGVKLVRAALACRIAG